MNDENTEDNQGRMRWFIGKATQKKARQIVIAYCCADLAFTLLAACGLLEFRWISVFAFWFAGQVPPLRPMIDLSPPSTLNLAVCIFISACLTGIAVFVVCVGALDEFVEDFRRSRLKHRLQKLLLFPIGSVLFFHGMSIMTDPSRLPNGFGARSRVFGTLMYGTNVGMGILGAILFLMIICSVVFSALYVIAQIVIGLRWIYERNNGG